jgi:hypothetical protein
MGQLARAPLGLKKRRYGSSLLNECARCISPHSLQRITRFVPSKLSRYFVHHFFHFFILMPALNIFCYSLLSCILSHWTSRSYGWRYVQFYEENFTACSYWRQEILSVDQTWHHVSMLDRKTVFVFIRTEWILLGSNLFYTWNYPIYSLILQDPYNMSG